ncbi:protein O-mannosyl-transferase TMTC1-like isoform X3 [Thrips palmi]|uniref:dolichyl-phosphate-mannose--protein mannosyltransferase n=1 Tax=Thrips palmi TaxID=161013 RepID=A0A6P8YUF0_THRPL|nr:protein O-mannosyl-transferase TMTC1-like isoform X3 [Thrips palmi]
MGAGKRSSPGFSITTANCSNGCGCEEVLEASRTSSRTPSRTCREARPPHKQSRGAASPWMYAGVAATAAGCYVNALWGDFVHDDVPAVTTNKDVLGLTPLRGLLANDFWGTSMALPSSHKSYRPLTTLTFRTDHLVWGLRPVGFHLGNVALHLLACLLVARLAVSVAKLQPPFAALAALLFAAHPVHTEAVAGVVGRADVLAGVFFLLSFLAYHDSEWRAPRVGASVLLAVLALLSKETGIMALPVGLLFDLYRTWSAVRRSVRDQAWTEESWRFAQRALKVTLSVALLLLCRWCVLQGSMPRFARQDNPAAFHPDPLVRLLTLSYVAALHGWLLVCPASLSHDWQFGSVPLVTTLLGDGRNAATACALAALGLVLYRCFADFEYQRSPCLVLGTVVLTLAFLPASNLLVTVGFVLAERVLYMPSVGAVLLVAEGAQRLAHWLQARRRPTTPLLWATLFLLGVLAARTVVRNRDWSTRESLILSGLRAVPNNAKLHYNLANWHKDSQREGLAALHYRKALRLWPDYASAANNLGTLLRDPAEAEVLFLEAIRAHPEHVNAHYNLGHVYRRWNRTGEAVRMLEWCLQLDPWYAPASLLLASLQPHRAGAVYRALAHRSPSVHGALYARWLLQHNRVTEALHHLRQSLRAHPENPSEDPERKVAFLGLLRATRAAGQTGRVRQLVLRWRVLFLPRGRPWASSPLTDPFLLGVRLQAHYGIHNVAHTEAHTAHTHSAVAHSVAHTSKCGMSLS